MAFVNEKREKNNEKNTERMKYLLTSMIVCGIINLTNKKGGDCNDNCGI